MQNTEKWELQGAVCAASAAGQPGSYKPGRQGTRRRRVPAGSRHACAGCSPDESSSRLSGTPGLTTSAQLSRRAFDQLPGTAPLPKPSAALFGRGYTKINSSQFYFSL